MNTLRVLSLALPVLSLVACSENEYYPDSGCRISVLTSQLIDGDSQTRVSVDISTNSPKFPFTVNDTLGIFPTVGDQVSFPLSGNVGQTTSTFDGGGWKVKDGINYYAYLPFSRKNFASYDMKNKIGVTFMGQSQDGFNNTNDIEEYVYMSTEGSQPNNGNIHFQLRHIGALARIGVTFPEAATYTKIHILAENDVFSTTGSVDLESNSVNINPITRSDRMTLSLKNVKITSSNLSTSYNFYMMFPPCDCSGQTLKIVLVDSFGNTYTANTRTDKANVFKAGAYYGFTPSDSFVKEAGSTDENGGNIGFLVESEEMNEEDVHITF